MFLSQQSLQDMQRMQMKELGLEMKTRLIANTSSPCWIVACLWANFLALQLISVIHPSAQPSEHGPLINIKRAWRPSEEQRAS